MRARATRHRKPSPLARLASPPALLALGLLLILIGIIAATTPPTRGAAEPVTRDGLQQAAPDFSLPVPAGNASLTLSNYRGRYVLLNFWATWCPPCRAELPDLAAYYAAHADEGFILIGVNEQESPATVSRYLAEQGLDFPVVLDGNGVVMARYGVTGLPSSFLINPEGQIVQMWTGMISRATLERAVTPRLSG